VVADCLAQVPLSPFWFVILSVVYFPICTPLPSVSVSLLACWASCLRVQYMLELMGGLCMYVESGHCLGCALNGKNSFVPLFSNCQINDSVWHVNKVNFIFIMACTCVPLYKTVEIGLKGRGLGNSWLFFSSSDIIVSLGLELLVRPYD
jgi:hypothetical protein